jgi:hypothetical protein
MTIRGPPATGEPDQPDNTIRVDSVRAANNRQLNARADLPPSESRRSYTIVFGEGESFGTGIGYTRGPLAPGATQPLVVAETATVMPYQPPPATNVITESVSISTNNPVQIESYVDGDLANNPIARPGEVVQDQIAALQELLEFVTTLDGSHTLEFRAKNVDPENDLIGSIRIRTIQRDVS